MQLVRLARIELESASLLSESYDKFGGEENGLRIHAARVTVPWTWRDTLLAYVTKTLRRRGPRPSPPRWFVQALVGLEDLPDVTSDNRVLIPPDPRQRLEAEITLMANLLAVASHSRRTIRAPFPSIGLLPDSDSDRSWLADRECFAAPVKVPSGTGVLTPCDILPLLPQLQDRLNGVSLLAEALSAGTAGGEIREHMRLFELSFGQANRELIGPLGAYLEAAPYGYTKDEVKRWITGVRHPLTHADRGGFLLDDAVLVEQFRIRQAAFDVLLNKANWRARDSRRRRLWAPEAFQGPHMGHVQLGSKPHFMFRIFDEVGIFQRVPKWTITELPEGFWFKWPPLEEQKAAMAKATAPPSTHGQEGIVSV